MHTVSMKPPQEGKLHVLFMLERWHQFSKKQVSDTTFQLRTEHRGIETGIMPRGGARQGSGRKGLGKRRMTVYLKPEIAAVLSMVATSYEISMGAAIEKVIDPDFVITPTPQRKGGKVRVFRPWATEPWISLNWISRPTSKPPN